MLRADVPGFNETLAVPIRQNQFRLQGEPGLFVVRQPIISEARAAAAECPDRRAFTAACDATDSGADCGSAGHDFNGVRFAAAVVADAARIGVVLDPRRGARLVTGVGRLLNYFSPYFRLPHFLLPHVNRAHTG